jgi:hypothetical protein
VIQDLADARNGIRIAPMRDWQPNRQTLSQVGYEAHHDRSGSGIDWKDGSVAQYRMTHICRVAATPPSAIFRLVARGQGAPSTIIPVSNNKRAGANTFARPHPGIVVFFTRAQLFLAMRREYGRGTIPLIAFFRCRIGFGECIPAAYQRGPQAFIDTT